MNTEEDELSEAYISSASPTEVTTIEVTNEISGKANEIAKRGQNDTENETEDGVLNQTIVLYMSIIQNYHMNRLAGQYYYSRHFYVLFLPTIFSECSTNRYNCLPSNRVKTAML